MAVSLNGPAVGNQSPVSGYTVVADFPALLALPAPTDGQTAVVAAPVIGTLLTGGIPRTRWVYIGGDGWRLDGSQHLVLAKPEASGAASTSEQTLHTMVIAAGLVPRLRQMDLAAVAGRDGTTDQITLRIRVGGGNATPTASTASTQRSVSLYSQVTAHSDTELRAVWNGASVVGGGGSSSVQPVTFPIPSMSSALVLSASIQMTGTTNIGTLYYLAVLGV